MASINTVAVFGSGLMGSGIAQIIAQADVKVRLADVTDKALQHGMAIIKKSAERIAKKAAPGQEAAFVKRVLDNITPTTDPSTAVKDADLVIESIVEDLKLKQDLFAALDKVAKPSAIFATNTSALLVKEISENCSAARKQRFGGFHFFNPVPVMKLVEVIRGDDMVPEAFDTLFEFGKRIGKVPVKCKDTPGFIVNRLLLGYNREAFAMAERGDATFQDIDKAMMLGAGYPMGPFQLADYVGLDTSVHVGRGWQARAAQGYIPKELASGPSKMTQELVDQGHFGRKTGKGFYDYKNEKNSLK